MEIRFKRFLSLAMAIIMVVSMTPANVVFATENTACEHTAKTETTVAATCTENGSVTETCDACGAVISQTVIGAGHKYEGTVTKAPTCTEAGEKTFTCAVCSDSYTESVDALGHSTEETVTKAPTCTEAGEKTFTCAVCGDSYTESVDALGHSTEETVTKTPTCTEAGEKTVTCTVCEFSETVAVDALGHTYDEGEVTTEATCTVDGVKTFTCTVCGDTKTEAIPVIDHVFDAEGNCACGEKQIEATANEHTEHSYEMGSAKCTACDYVEEGYLLFILNGDGSVGMSIDGSKSVSAFCLRTALEDARVFANNAFLFGITGTPSYVVYMYEDSTENASFEIGADVTINGNGHKIVCAEGVTVTNNGTLNDVEIVETKPACEHPTHGTDGKCECGATVAHTYTDGKCTVCGAVDPDYVAPAPTEVVVATLAELQEALADNTNDLPIVVTETITIPAGETVTLNLNGKTIIATDNKAANVSYELFYIYGGLTVTGNGTIELTSTSNDTSWAKSSTIFHNRGGVLVIQSGTFTHKGGTAMAYVVDNNANSYGNATTTIKGGNLSSTYVAIRNRMDTYGANGGGNGVATLNIEGGSLSGKRAVWGQVSSAGCKGNITITGGNFSAWEGEPAVRVGTDETGEIVTAISGGTFTSDVSAYVVEGYVQNENGTVTVAPSEPEAPTEVKVATLAELQTAMDDNSNDLPIVVTETITIPAGETVVIDLNSKTVTSVYQTDSTTKHIYPLDVYGNLTIKDTKGNGTITGRGIFVRSGSKLTIDGGSIYAIDSNGGSALFMYGGEVVINGGHIEQKAEGTYNFAIQAPDGATVTVNGGWVGGNHGAIAATGAAVVINDGTFVCTGTAGMTDNVLYSDSNGSIIINGGNFVADKDIPAGGTCVYDANGGVTINGGTFGNSSGGDVWGVTGTTIKGGTFENLIETQHIADGYELGEDGTVIKKQPAAPAVTVDEVKVVITDNGNNSYDVVLGDEESFPETGVTMTFPATGDTNGMAYVVHEHAGKNYIYVGKVAGGKFSFKNTVGFSTFTVADGDLADAIAAAESGATVTIIADIEDVEVEVVKNLTITGSAKLNNVTINALNAAELTVSGLTFTGNSWINSAAKLSVSSVTANVAPSNSAYTNSRNAFISLGRNEGKDIEITVKNSTICTTNNADAINGWARIIKADISGNNFGSENAKYGYGTNVVKIMGVATNAELTFAENTVYADYNGFAIAPNNTRDNHYTVIFDGNKFFGTADFMWIETQGAAYNYTYAAVNATSDNTINGNAITAADIKTSETTWYCYAGLDVVTDENGKVIGGTLAYCAEDAIADGFELGEDGKVTATAPAYVAQIGEQKFETLDAALNAAKTMTGDVVVEIYDKVTLNSALSGSFDSIKFFGKDTDAEIYLDVQGYITATGKRVFFEDLKLSKSEGGFVDNAGFMNLAFGIYDVAEITYTDCTFLNGACASFGKVTFNGCTFYRSHDRYGLWAYGAADVVVDGCTFDDIRGIKLFSEGKKQVTDLTVKNTTFTEKVDGKPAIVLTYGKSVTLENNTYSSTGVFELDLDGKPNGTPVTSDVAPTCVNDKGACGVLVDGKIYTTVAQAAEVATSGSKVTLLHESTETVELAEGVILNKNGFTAAGVTVAEPAYVAEVNGTQYKTLSEALGAVTADDQTVTILADVEENLTASLRGNIVSKDGAKVTITLTNSDWVYCPYSFVLGENITLNVPALFYYAGGAVIKGEVVAGAYYQRYAGTKLTINEPGSMTVKTETFILRYTDGDGDAGIYIVGDNNDETVGLNASVIYFYQGMINAKDADIKVGTYWQTNETDGQGSANLVLDNSKLNVTVNEQIAKATGNSTVTLMNGSAVTVAGGYQGVGITMDDTSTFTKNGVSIFQAKVNNVAYTTLAAAIAAANTGDEITLLADVILDTAVEVEDLTYGGTQSVAVNIPAEKTITLDLNGHNIETSVNMSGTYTSNRVHVISNFGNLTIVDSATTKGAIISNVSTDNTNQGGYTIFNQGTLLVNGATVIGNNGRSYALTTRGTAASTTVQNATVYGRGALAVEGGATVDVESGLYYSNESNRSTSHALYIADGKVTINGGTFKSKTAYNGFAVNMGDGNLTIKAGEFVGHHNGETLNNCIYLAGGSTGTVEIEGGNFNYGLEKAGTSTGNFVVSGGTFGQAIAEKYCAEGYIPVDNGNGTYSVAVDRSVAEVNGVKFESLAAAIEAAQAGDEIDLLADVKLSGKLTITKAITIDGNGHSIIADETAVWYTVSGKLNIKSYKTHLIGVNSDNITLKNVTLDCNNNAAGINVYCAQNVTFDNVSIINATKGMAALTVNGSTLTVKNAFSALGNSMAIDMSNGSGVTSALGMTAEEGTVFNLGGKTTRFSSSAVHDLTGAVDANGEPYFAAMDNAYYYTEAQMESRTTAFSNGLTLLKDVELTNDKAAIKGTLNLNGHELTSTTEKLTVPAGYILVPNDEGTYSVVVDPAYGKGASITSGETVTYYDTLTDAMAAAQANDTITLLANVELTATATIDKAITLDLNGHVISGTKTAAVYSSLIHVANTGALTVKDSAGEGKISYAAGVGGAEGAVIWNEGDLVLESGTLETTGTWSIGYAVDVRPNAWGSAYTNKDVTFAMNGGKINTSDAAIRVANDCSDGYADITVSFTMNGGEINSAATGIFIQQLTPIYDDLKVVIKGGAITASTAPIRFHSGNAPTSYRNGTNGSALTIEGGSITAGTGGSNYIWAVNGMVRVSGGADVADQLADADITVSKTFAQSNNELADGYKWAEKDGAYVLTACDYVAQIGEVKYESLQEAVDAANAGDTVTLLADIALDATVKIPAGKTVTLDLNGKTIDGTEKVNIAIMSNGDLTLKDSSTEQTGTIKAGKHQTDGKHSGNTINICNGSFTMESGKIYSVNNAILVDENVTNVVLNGGVITAEKETKNSAALCVQPYNDGRTEITINGGTFEGYFGILISKNTKLNITGGTITGVYGTGLQGNGTYDSTEINISGGSITGKEAAMYHPQNGVLNISGNAVLTGDTGVVIKSGKVTISGGTINGTGEAKAYAPESSGFAGTGDGLYVEHYDNSTNSENYGTPVVTVTGGTFNSTNGKAVASYANSNNNVEALGAFISNGTFSSDVTDLCVAGYKAEKNDDGTYSVKVALPEVVITDIKGNLTDSDPDLTFALNFAIKDIDKLTEEYLADLMEAYGDHYVDYVLTISGLTDESVTFNSDGEVDGYLAGQYDAWSENWVSVPFGDDVTIENGQSLYIMEYAAKLMGKQGLRFTLVEVAEIVQNFDCGVYFTPEFLSANPNMKVDLQLKVFTEDAEGNKIDNIDVAENNFEVKNFAAVVSGEDKQSKYFATFAEAMAAAVAGDTVTLLHDVNLTELVKIEKAITLDLGGKKITSTAQKAIEVYANATIQNGTIEAAQRCVDTRKAVELTLTDVTLIADKYTSHGNPQPLTIGGSENGTKVTMTNVNISAADGYGIITFVKTELTATDSTISGYSALYVKPGSEGSEFKFVNSDLTGSTTNNDVEGNSFSTIAVRADDVTVNVDANSTVNATGNYCWAISMESKFANENGITGSTVNVAGTINGQILTSVDTSKNTISVKAEYADELATAGYACSAAAANGMITVLGKAVAKVGETLYTTLQAAVDAAERGAKITMVADTKEETVWLNKAVTLDLNGYTVEADYFVAMNGTQVLNTKTTGILKVSQEGLTLSITNTYIPVWNESNGYYLVDWAYGTKLDTSVAGLAKYTFIAIPRNGTTTNLEVVRLMQNGSLDNELEINVWLSWSNDLGEMTQTFRYNTDTISTVYTENPTAATRGTMFYLNVTGYENFDTVTMRAAVESARAMVDVANLKTIPNN